MIVDIHWITFPVSLLERYCDEAWEVIAHRIGSFELVTDLKAGEDFYQQLGVIAQQFGKVIFRDDTLTNLVSKVGLRKIYWSKCSPQNVPAQPTWV